MPTRTLFARRGAPIAARGGSKGAKSDPRSLSGLELYLDARMGVTPTTDGAIVTNWADQSGHSPARDAIEQNTFASNQAKYRSISSLNGSPGVNFEPQVSGQAAAVGSGNPNPWPAGTNSGITVIAYGRFRSSPITAGTVPFHFSELFQDSLGKLQLGWQWGTAANNELGDWGWTDNSGHVVGSLNGDLPIYGSLAWRGSGGPSGTANWFENMTLNPLTHAWSEVLASTTNGYIIGGNQVGNGGTSMDLFALCWWSRDLTDYEMVSVHNFFVEAFG